MQSSKRVQRLLAKGNTRGLCRLLRGQNALARRQAAQALGSLADPAAVPCLLRAVREDQDQYVRRWSIQSLEAIGTDGAVDALTEAMFSLHPQEARMAEQSLRRLSSPQARAALQVADVLLQHDWDALGRLGEAQKRTLAAVLRSEQYASWPSARRRRVLETAVELDVTPPDEVSGQLADMGLYVSGVHSIVDLLAGLFHRSPEVRTSAAERLGDSEQAWTTPILYLRYRREMRSGDDPRVAAALARALDRLGDPRPIERLRLTLEEIGGQQAADAAYLLASIGTPTAIQALFDYASNPPAPPAYRNVPLALSALQRTGAAAVEVLAPRAGDESPEVRRLMVDVIARSSHAERFERLVALARDADPSVQRAALDALARDNSPRAAEALFELDGVAPREVLVEVMSTMTDPAGARYLHQLAPGATIITGQALDDDRTPLNAAQVQILEERHLSGDDTWHWQAVSPRADTDAEGGFTVALPGWSGDSRLRLKLVIPARRAGLSAETHVAALPLECGATNRVRVHIDRFFDRLAVDVEPISTPPA